MTVAADYCEDDPQLGPAGSLVLDLSEGMEHSRNTVARRTPEGCGHKVSLPPEERRWRVSFDLG